jgi:glutamine synthetase
MAEILARYAEELEQAEDFDSALHTLVCRSFTEHQRIIFNGNGYSKEWEEEAARRGLSNLRSTPESLDAYLDPKNAQLFKKHGIFTENEFRARYEIHLEAYCKLTNIEARTSIDMVLHQILPAATAYTSALASGILSKESAGISCKAEKALAKTLSDATDHLFETCQQLQSDLETVPAENRITDLYYHSMVLSRMEALRHYADILEKYTDKSYWPYPTYSDLLYY